MYISLQEENSKVVTIRVSQKHYPESESASRENRG